MGTCSPTYPCCDKIHFGATRGEKIEKPAHFRLCVDREVVGSRRDHTAGKSGKDSTSPAEGTTTTTSIVVGHVISQLRGVCDRSWSARSVKFSRPTPLCPWPTPRFVPLWTAAQFRRSGLSRGMPSRCVCVRQPTEDLSFPPSLCSLALPSSTNENTAAVGNGPQPGADEPGGATSTGGA